MLNGLSLFTGIGGLDVALSDWVRPVAYCEIDPYCQGVLLSRMATGDIRTSPIWDDITTLDGSEFESEIDVIYGGFPCQDISIAGNGKGLEGERSGLFFEIVRLAKEIKPSFIFLENVPAITCRGGLRVVREITEMGYDCRWCIISAASIGALHRRERWFLLAHANDNGSSTSERRGGIRGCTSSGKGSQEQKEMFGKIERANCISSDVADPMRQGLQIGEKERQFSEVRPTQRSDWWDSEPSVGRMVNGLPNRVDRIKCLGNSVVPCQAKEAFKILMGIKI